MTERRPSPVVALIASAGSWEARLTADLRDLGLTTRRLGLLAHLDALPDLSFSELARRTGITVQSAHTAVRQLAADGLVDDATAHAGARSALRLTERGRAALVEAQERVATLDAALAAEQPALAAALAAARPPTADTPIDADA
ncbi:MarR family winged helix-turn-helix transcriptional regulator [Agrococcus jejuensis]|uniref:DNA-binding transcriptional regulator, MarR family n=1 Tax=Agrococcus jejuensis TaxID=399736 RepID=A0A1G8GEH4_9MICO|nr:helix-turn-helix domain-containing protein [Agrococcus jejuensis]SDH92697.1 DNA-binding transcriptional regulator, MarR family [Agrococcus jejuensis]